jgi:hypothetical protein
MADELLASYKDIFTPYARACADATCARVWLNKPAHQVEVHLTREQLALIVAGVVDGVVEGMTRAVERHAILAALPPANGRPT